MTNFVDDYEFGQHVVREFTRVDPAHLDPAMVEHVGAELRPVLLKGCEEIVAAWQAIPWHVRTRWRIMAWLSRMRAPRSTP